MFAAVEALRLLRPARIVVAVPAAPQSTCRKLAALVDEVICATSPTPFVAVGQSYWNFEQVSDSEVRGLLTSTLCRPSMPRPRPSPREVIRQAALPVQAGVPSDDVLFDIVGDARVVLIGEATHGTREFYSARAAITERLIEQGDFHAIAVEADWPDAYRVNRYVRLMGDDGIAEQALGGFERFPTWMWRNATVLDFIGRLRAYNSRLNNERFRVGFYGLDLYSLYRSIDEVVKYLDHVDPAAAARARRRYACFDHRHGENGEAWGFAAAFGAGETCESEVLEQLLDLQDHAFEYARRDGLLAEDELFFAEQNAHTIKSAAEYYRIMYTGRSNAWNLRDQHMAGTLAAIDDHLTHQRGKPAKIVVWAHNSHIGDARATEFAARGELNLGQLVRERYGSACRNIGFTTYRGTVTAANEWNQPAGRRAVRPALPGSAEDLLHSVGLAEFVIPFDAAGQAAEALRSVRLERAIGVIYRPETERHSHYFQARLADQFDAVIHIDTTQAVEPLEMTPYWESGEVPETYPFAV